MTTGFVLERLGGGGAGAEFVMGDFGPLVGGLELKELSFTGFRGTSGLHITVLFDGVDAIDAVDTCDRDRVGILPEIDGWFSGLFGCSGGSAAPFVDGGMLLEGIRGGWV